MGHDTLSGGSVEAGGDGLRATRPRATRRLGPRARRRSGSLPRPRARRLARFGECTPCRGLPWRASGETETALPAEAFPGEPRARRSLFQNAETSCSRLEARGDGLRTTQPRAIRRMRPRTRRRSGSLPRPCVRRLARYGECTPCQDLPWRASGEAETAFPAEAFPGEPRARRSLRQDAETSCLKLEARRRGTQWARLWQVRGPRLTL